MEDISIFVGARRDDDDVAPANASCCNLCGDVGFRQALLPCGARGCSRLQHTYCGSRYCPEVVDDVKRWRCEWCAREDANHQVQEEEEEDDLRRKRNRRVVPPISHSSLPPPEIKRASSSPQASSTDKERRTARESTARTHAPRPTDVSAEADTVMHKDNQSISTRGGSSRALDRWKNLAKTTRLGGKKYKLLADVLC